MESKLKQLKVADLKDLLNRAQVSIPARANKPDLIATIIENPAALNVYDDLYGGGSARPSGANTPRPPVVEEPEAKNQVTAAVTPKEQDILAPPEPFDWNAGVEASAESNAKNITESATVAASKPLSKRDTVPAAAAAQPKPSSGTQKPSETKTDVPAADEDEETKRRRARAERFGVPLVTTSSQIQNKKDKKATKPAAKEATASSAEKKNETNGGAKTKMTKNVVPVEDDPEKLKARAMRFGLVEKTKHVKPSSEGAAAVTGQKSATPTASTGQKRAAPATESADTEEAERRRKRAERFGLPVKT